MERLNQLRPAGFHILHRSKIMPLPVEIYKISRYYVIFTVKSWWEFCLLAIKCYYFVQNMRLVSRIHLTLCTENKSPLFITAETISVSTNSIIDNSLKY